MKITQKQLLNKLVEWGSKNKNSRDLWSRNKIAKVIKSFVKQRGNWQNAPRGDPAKGFRIMRENKSRNESG